jgi:hypothetical protein
MRREHFGRAVRAGKDESAVLDESDPLKTRARECFDGSGHCHCARHLAKTFGWRLYGHGAFLFQNGKAVEHFTFEEPAALCDPSTCTVFRDQEQVVWFATDKASAVMIPTRSHEAVSE